MCERSCGGCTYCWLVPGFIGQGLLGLPQLHMTWTPRPLTAAMQVASRLWVLWGIVYLAPEDTTRGYAPFLGAYGPSFTSLVTAWALSEIIRYGFFAAKVGRIQSMAVTS